MSVFNELKNINLSDIDVSDIQSIGTAPAIVKGILIGVLCIVVLVAGYMLDTTEQFEKLERTEREEEDLKIVFKEKQAKAANLEAYKQQLEEMRRSFGALLRQLPDNTEIESLLTDISQTGVASGLDIEYFKPKGLKSREFYAEYPIDLKVSGRYHEFAQFVSGVAALPRIVTLQDIIIEPMDKNSPDGKLIMGVTATTYQYLEEK